MFSAEVAGHTEARLLVRARQNEQDQDRPERGDNDALDIDPRVTSPLWKTDSAMYRPRPPRRMPRMIVPIIPSRPPTTMLREKIPQIAPSTTQLMTAHVYLLPDERAPRGVPTASERPRLALNR